MDASKVVADRLNNTGKDPELLAEGLLKSVGVHTGDYLVDFGCGSGNYAIAAAKIVGTRGKVYAVDKDPGQLDIVQHRAASERLGNVKRINTSGQSDLPMEDACIDVVLVYDVLHSSYFPYSVDRRKLLSEAQRVLKSGGLLSIYPTHLEGDPELNVDVLKNEVEEAGFSGPRSQTGILVHSGSAQKDTILNFRKAKRPLVQSLLAEPKSEATD